MKFVKATVGAIIIDNDRVLLAQRNHDPFYDHWCFPGGHIDFSEEVADAMIREVKEETGLDVTGYNFFHYFTEFHKELDWHAVVLIFIAKTKGTLKRQEEEVKKLQWFPLKEALNLKLAFGHKTILEKYLEKK